MKKPKQSSVRIGAAIGGVVMIGLLAWLILADGDSSESSEGATRPVGAEIVSVGSLREAAAARETPIYWAGPPEGSRLELSRPDPERTYVRYLTGGAHAGDPRPFLTVSSYELPDPAAALRRQGKQGDGVLVSAPGNGTVYFSRDRPENIYVAYPGVDVQIEVYAPDFKRALQLVTSGRIVPVD